MFATERAIFAEEATAGEVGHGVTAAIDGAAQRRRDARFGQVIAEDVGLERDERRDRRSVEPAKRVRLCRRARKPGVRGDTIRVRDRVLLRGERPARRALCTDLGEDLDHTVGGFGTVERRSCGTFQHFDARDGVRVDVVEPRGCAAATAVTLIAGAVVHADAINENDRLVGLRE